MELQELLTLNQEGFIPGPNEPEDRFVHRVQVAKKNFLQLEAAIPVHHWEWSRDRLNSLFDFSPRWCAAISSPKGLTPWQAAATWIDVNRFYTIQINPSRWVEFLIDRDELLAHEAAHAARAAFDEPIYEEFFAYLTSNAKWRQVLGAFFRKPQEVLIFLGVVVCASVLQVAEVIWDLPAVSSICFLSAAAMCFFWSARLLRARLLLKKASICLLGALRNPSFLLPVLFRLTDAEIRSLAVGKCIRADDLRWRLIKAAYLMDDVNFATPFLR